MSPAVSSDGTLFFSSNCTGNEDFYYAELLPNGSYADPKLLPGTINSKYPEWGLYVSPNQDFMIFMSDKRPGGFGGCDLYVSFKKNGEWSPAVNLGPKINTAGDENFPFISPDGKYLFFSRWNAEGTSIYYIDWKPVRDLVM